MSELTPDQIVQVINNLADDAESVISDLQQENEELEKRLAEELTEIFRLNSKLKTAVKALNFYTEDKLYDTVPEKLNGLSDFGNEWQGMGISCIEEDHGRRARQALKELNSDKSGSLKLDTSDVEEEFKK